MGTTGPSEDLPGRPGWAAALHDTGWGGDPEAAGLTLSSGSDQDPVDEGRPCENLLLLNCRKAFCGCPQMAATLGNGVTCSDQQNVMQGMVWA